MYSIVRYSLVNPVREIVCLAPNRQAAWRWVGMLKATDPSSEYTVIEGDVGNIPAVWRN